MLRRYVQYTSSMIVSADMSGNINSSMIVSAVSLVMPTSYCLVLSTFHRQPYLIAEVVRSENVLDSISIHVEVPTSRYWTRTATLLATLFPALLYFTNPRGNEISTDSSSTLVFAVLFICPPADDKITPM